MQQNDYEKKLDLALSSTRLLVFIESKPLSNKYRQVLLNAEEFKNLSFSLGKVVGKEDENTETVELRFSEEVYDLPDLQEFYEIKSN
jgi:hypothetical protein